MLTEKLRWWLPEIWRMILRLHWNLTKIQGYDELVMGTGEARCNTWAKSLPEPMYFFRLWNHSLIHSTDYSEHLPCVWEHPGCDAATVRQNELTLKRWAANNKQEVSETVGWEVLYAVKIGIGQGSGAPKFCPSPTHGATFV